MVSDLIEIHTDGSCKVNPGPGGWGVVILYPGGEERHISGCNEGDHTTNNKMEIMAVIKGLLAIPVGSRVKVYTDSAYVLGAMGWDWRGGGPLRKKNNRNTNHDILEQLDQLVAERNVFWQHEEAHKGNFYNELADKLANKAADVRGGIDERKN